MSKPVSLSMISLTGTPEWLDGAGRGASPWSLAPGRVDIWRADLAMFSEIGERLGSLVPNRSRLASLPTTSAPSKPPRALSFGLVRLLLAHYLGASPRTLPIVTSPQGKPQLPPDHPRAGLCWSVSHTGHRLLFVIAQEQRVGIDLESNSREIEVEKLARRFFTRIEYNDIYAAQAHMKREVFLRIWTAKESVAKATGCGLAGTLSNCEVRQQGHGHQAVVFDRGEETRREWPIAYCDPWPGFVAAVTVEGGSPHVSCWDLTPTVATDWLAIVEQTG